MKISFIGLGHMGAPMARNLMQAGHALVVFDIVKANVEALTAAGAAAANSPKECAAQGEIVITMLLENFRLWLCLNLRVRVFG